MSRILIVEDEGILAKSMARLLIMHGHEVPTCVATSDDAVAAAAALTPDLVLMDIHLKGGGDGIEAARRIRATRDIPIVFLTAYADREHVERAKLTAPHAYLLKPYSDRELLTTVDVVVHKHHLERELRARERWLATTLRSIGDGVVAVGVDHRIQFLNPEAERLTGWSSDAAAGRPVTEVLQLIAEDGDQPRELPLTAAMQDGAIHGLAGPTVLIARDGGRRPIDDSVAAIADDDGTVVGGVVVFRDVSERRALESRLALADRVASLATLTAGIGHEINNPLSYNLANLEILLAGLPGLRGRLESPEPLDAPARAALVDQLEELHEAARDASMGANRIRDILKTLRGFARDPQRAPALVSVVDALDAALRITANELGLHGAVEPELLAAPMVRGHEGQLCQVFTNLLVNAAQALPEDRAALRPIQVRVTETEHDAIIAITDAGVGIPPEVMIRIFDPFFTTKAVGMGSGLGLSIVHDLVKAHGGEVTVTSKVGVGSTFQVRLPRVAAPTGPIVEAQPAPVAATRLRVLIVDDDVTVAAVLVRVLRPHHEVVAVHSGRAALERIASAEPDVILSDIMMPEMTGIELHGQILATHPELARRMLFITGGAFTPATQQFVATMAERVLHKPVTARELRAALARAAAKPG